MKVPYSYANAVAVSSHKTLIPKSRFLSAIDAKTADEALKTLTSGGFGKNADINGAGEYEKAVAAETIALKDFVNDYSRGNDVRFYCFLKSDFFNCDVAVRRQVLGVDAGYAKDGLTDTAVIEEFVKSGKGELPAYLEVAVGDLKTLCKNGSPSGAEMSFVAIKDYYAAALKLIKNRLIRDMIKTEIDCANVSAYTRSSSKEAAEKQFISGGKLKKEKLAVLQGGDNGKIRDAFLFSPYKDLVDACVRAKSENRPLSEFEKIKDDYPMKRLDAKRYASEGITPVLLYAAYKRAEIKNFRTVISGKLANAPAETIAGRLRDGYVG